MQLCQQATSSK